MNVRKPKFSDWLLAPFFFAFALLIWFMGFSETVVAETDLTPLSGIPREVKVSKDELQMKLGDWQIDYRSNLPKFDLIANVVQARIPVETWVSPKHDGKSRLVAFSAGNEVILSYADSHDYWAYLQSAIASSFLAVVAIAIWTLFMAFHWRRSYAEFLRGQAEKVAEADLTSDWTPRSLQFSPTVEDVLAMQRYFTNHDEKGRQRHGFNFLYIALTILGMYVAVCLTRLDGPGLALPSSVEGWIWFGIGGLIFLGIAYLGAQEILIPLRTRRQLQQPEMKSVFAPTTVSIHAEGYTVVKEAPIVTSWHDIDRVLVNDEQVYFVRHKKEGDRLQFTFFPIPQRAFLDMNERRQFVAAARKLLDEAKKSLNTAITT